MGAPAAKLLALCQCLYKKKQTRPERDMDFYAEGNDQISMAISGSDWLEVPTIYKNIPTKYGLIWYSTSILGFWNSHWRLCFMVIIGYGFILFDVYDKLTMITINGCPTITIKHIIQWFILFDNYLMITIILYRYCRFISNHCHDVQDIMDHGDNVMHE